MNFARAYAAQFLRKLEDRKLLKLAEKLCVLASGAALGIAAWGEGRTALAALLLPLALTLVGGRINVYLFAFAYHLAVLRGAVDFIGNWFESSSMGIAAWLAFGVVGAIPWTLAWCVNPARPWTRGASATGGFLLSLMPWFAVLQGGHPIYGWGFALQGWGWFGIALALAFTWGAASISGARQRGCLLGILLIALCIVSLNQERLQMRAAGPFIAANTSWGAPPKNDGEAIDRYSAVSEVLQKVGAKKLDPQPVLVFAETTLGRYDNTFMFAHQSLLKLPARLYAVNAVIGREFKGKNGEMLNQAVFIDSSGKEQVVNQRQPALLSMWAPWRNESFSIGWMRDTKIQVTPDISARVVICYEEFLPFITLLDEWRGGHDVTLVMANAWPTKDDALRHVQATHTEGLARLFNRKIVRAENTPAI